MTSWRVTSGCCGARKQGTVYTAPRWSAHWQVCTQVHHVHAYIMCSRAVCIGLAAAAAAAAAAAGAVLHRCRYHADVMHVLHCMACRSLSVVPGVANPRCRVDPMDTCSGAALPREACAYTAQCMCMSPCIQRDLTGAHRPHCREEPLQPAAAGLGALPSRWDQDVMYPLMAILPQKLGLLSLSFFLVGSSLLCRPALSG